MIYEKCTNINFTDNMKMSYITTTSLQKKYVRTGTNTIRENFLYFN